MLGPDGWLSLPLNHRGMKPVLYPAQPHRHTPQVKKLLQRSENSALAIYARTTPMLRNVTDQSSRLYKNPPLRQGEPLSTSAIPLR
jgi:hypothetical protein